MIIQVFFFDVQVQLVFNEPEAEPEASVSTNFKYIISFVAKKIYEELVFSFKSEEKKRMTSFLCKSIAVKRLNKSVTFVSYKAFH